MQRAEPTDIIHLPPVTQCLQSQAEVNDIAVNTVACRQRIDVPPPSLLQVTQDTGDHSKPGGCLLGFFLFRSTAI
jgi:hypothetical protein